MIPPRHWEFDRPVTWDEYARPSMWRVTAEGCGVRVRLPGILCADCHEPLTSFEATTRRMLDHSMVEIAYSDEDCIPMYEVICAKCAEAAP